MRCKIHRGCHEIDVNCVEIESQWKRIALDAVTKRVWLFIVSVSDLPTIPGELFAIFQTSFYSYPRDAVFKVLGGGE